MELESERMEREQLRHLSTADLIKHALTEARLLVKAEVLHAKKELKEEAKAARTSGILLGAAFVLVLCALSALFVALGLALPVGPALGVLIVGVALLLVTGLLAFVGVKKLPKKPLPHTQARLRTDLTLTRETLQ
ncbi:phage holin family protein [Aggregicoccus sp. 17bor-14]|nr:phage holin family protein [Simulacricoccus sp. 17bor-14]MRI91801.1 phage holin family protein [Aggregicoccus sp. 17bor-14]